MMGDLIAEKSILLALENHSVLQPDPSKTTDASALKVAAFTKLRQV
jgi:hypothetical protein